MGMGMGVNPYPPVYMGDPVGLFLCRGYGYGVVIPGGYLSIAISIPYPRLCLATTPSSQNWDPGGEPPRASPAVELRPVHAPPVTPVTPSAVSLPLPLARWPTPTAPSPRRSPAGGPSGPPARARPRSAGPNFPPAQLAEEIPFLFLFPFSFPIYIYVYIYIDILCTKNSLNKL
jgi:hypothetical protein